MLLCVVVVMYRTRNGTELQTSDKYKLSQENGLYRLTVLDVDPKMDAGDYLLSVSSPGGNLKCTATLDIKGGCSRILRDNHTSSCIFIIKYEVTSMLVMLMT